MKKCVAALAALAIAVVFSSTAQEAEARPNYLKAFVGKYDIAAAKEKKCGVCHGEGGKNKKVVSDYAKALGKALGKKNVKDADAIGAALDEAAKADAGGGKTYGDILKSGELPPAAP